MSPKHKSGWGQNWLDAPLSPGETSTFDVRPGTYLARASDCNGATLLVLYDYKVEDNRKLRLVHGSPESLTGGADTFPVTLQLAARAIGQKWAKTARQLPADPVHLRFSSACEHDLRVVLDNGWAFTMPAKSGAKLALRAGDALTLVDGDYGTLSELKVDRGTRRARIRRDCRSLTVGSGPGG